jgi:hypothetical protein
VEAGREIHVQPRVIAEVPETQMGQMHAAKMKPRRWSSSFSLSTGASRHCPRGGGPLACRRAGRPARRKKRRQRMGAGGFVRRRKFMRWFRAARRTPSTSGGTP